MRRRFYEIRTILFSNRVFRKFLHDMLCLVCIVAKLYNTKFSRFEEMNTYAHTSKYTRKCLFHNPPVAKGSTRDVTGKMAQFKMADVSNFKASFRIENGL